MIQVADHQPLGGVERQPVQQDHRIPAAGDGDKGGRWR
jgi:hypothetical protein